MFPLLIFLIVLTLPLTGEASTIEYWVRPDTVLECPQDTPQHQCVTVTDLVSYSTNSSLNQGRNITIHFLPGVHTPRVEGRILIENENWNTTNLTATLTGEQSGGTEAVLQCGLTSAKIAFVFNQVFWLVLRSVKIINCGFRTGVYLNSNLPTTEFLSHLNSKIASVAIVNVGQIQNSVKIDSVMISNSSGFGALIVQYCDSHLHNGCVASKLVANITNSIICYSNAHQPGEEFGGNLRILAETKEMYVITHNLTISYGCMGLATLPTSDRRNCGVDINATGDFLSFTFHSSRFVGNEANNGGGLYIEYEILNYLKGYKYNTLNSLNGQSYEAIKISNCTFLNNIAFLKGGGIFFRAYDTYEFLSVSMRSTLFNGNTAEEEGGALALDLLTNIGGWVKDGSIFFINECLFVKNTAEKGAAISVIHAAIYFFSARITLSQCLFTNNAEYAHSEHGSVIRLHNSEILLDNVKITDNNCRGLYLAESTVTINQTVIISNNHAVGASGGGILMDCGYSDHDSQLRFNQGSHLSIKNNRADKKGGGIYINSTCIGYHSFNKYIDCLYYTIVSNITQPVIIMANNTAIVAGNSIFMEGYYFIRCPYMTFWKIFKIVERNSSIAISSPPQKACICSSDYFTKELDCKTTNNITIFRGQTLNVSVMCVGLLDYPSSCVFQAEAITSGTEIALATKVVNAHCINFSYVIRIRSVEIKSYSLRLFSDMGNKEQINISNSVVIQTNINDCPFGLKTVLRDGNLVCICSDHLHREKIVCNIDELTLYKTAPMWVGNYSGDITVHRNCPFGYCKTNFTAVNIFNQQDQCDWNRSGVLCGACRPGLSLVLGTSQCKQCSNLYLLLLIPFALAGVILVLLLLKCNLTVSMGTINGLIFYANIVQATTTAFFPTGSNNTFTHILSVFIAWLNLDLGIETCFAEGLNTYYRTWLQFVFPVYIWSLVGVIIMVSRYSIKVSRWTGSNTVSVLATLFLLSYAKLLRVTFDVFTSTSLTDANGTTTLVWLLDGDYVFLQWPHSLLFTAALVTLLGHIVPFTALLLMSPTLQRYSHHKPLRWVNRMKPLLDAYQGPYKNNVRYWTGLLLLVRLIILSANAINVTGNQAVSLFTTNIVVTIMLLYLWVMVGNKLYRNRIPYFLEVFFIGNLQLYSLASLFLSSDKEVKLNAQEHLTYCMVCSALVVFMLIVVYHCYKLCLNTRQGKKVHQKLVSLLKKPETDFEEPPSADEAGPKHSSTPTTTVVELKVPLLVDDT